MKTKRCFKCRATKPVGEFYVSQTNADGLAGKCKECTKTAARTNYATTRAQKSAYDRLRQRGSKRRADKLAAQTRHRRRNPLKYKARNAVSNALRDGRLKKGPCKTCGATKNVQAHHSDYTEPLDVEWLCFSCHREERHGQVVTATDS